MQDSVTPAPGLMYPLIGLMLTMPTAPLPAGTLPGWTALCMVTVNCGATASTVTSCGGVVVVCPGAVPVIVMEYGTSAVSLLVVIVAEAVPGAVTVAGLTTHAGGSVKVPGVTAQLRLTVPLKPLIAPTVIFEAEVPPAVTASGENGAACKVKLPCANAADGKARQAANRQSTAKPARGLRTMKTNWSADHSHC